MSGVEGPGIEGSDLDDMQSQITTLTNSLAALTALVPPPEYAARHSTDTNGDLTVTFPGGLFAAGNTPVVRGDVIAPLSTDQFTIEMVGQPTNTTAIFKVRKFTGLSITGILGLIPLFNSTPGATGVHVRARLPT